MTVFASAGIGWSICITRWRGSGKPNALARDRKVPSSALGPPSQGLQKNRSFRDGLNNSPQAVAKGRWLQLCAFSAQSADLGSDFRVAWCSVGLEQQHLPCLQTHWCLRHLQLGPHHLQIGQCKLSAHLCGGLLQTTVKPDLASGGGCRWAVFLSRYATGESSFNVRLMCSGCSNGCKHARPLLVHQRYWIGVNKHSTAVILLKLKTSFARSIAG